MLRILEEQKDFDYDFYLFPSEYTIIKIIEERVATPIIIRLDNQARTFFIPQLSAQHRDLYTHLHYVFETSLLSEGSCHLYLNPVGAIQLKQRQADYTWLLDANALTDDALFFTGKGITIGGIQIEVCQPQGTYYFLDNKGATFLINFINSTTSLIAIDFLSARLDAVLLEKYIKVMVY